MFVTGMGCHGNRNFDLLLPSLLLDFLFLLVVILVAIVSHPCALFLCVGVSGYGSGRSVGEVSRIPQNSQLETLPQCGRRRPQVRHVCAGVYV